MKVSMFVKGLAIGGAAVLAAVQPAAAISYTVDVYEASVNGQFNAANSSVATLSGSPNLSHATFTYNGPLSFSNTTAQNTTNTGDLTSGFFGANAANISGYTAVAAPGTVPYGAAGANFQTLGGFLATSGSIAGYAYGSLYQFTSAVGSYGGTNLTITHDDGVSVYANGSLVPFTTAGPTSAITETVTLPTNTTQFEIAYGRENGSPSILNVAVPEPVSLTLLGSGLAAVGLLRRRTHVRA